MTSIVRIRGIVVPSGVSPVSCAACAVTRWLRIVGPVWTGFRGDVIRLLDPTRADLNRHDCEQPLPGEWWRAQQLLLPLDVHGWARTGTALSGRAMTSIIPARRAAAQGEEPLEVVGPTTRVPNRYDTFTLQETYDELGNTDSAVDEALARLAAVWHDAQALDTEIGSATSHSKQQIAGDSDR